jgi:hypothetical protein|tara:strand:- start:4823 stop:5239 length:417 start_codon:yes stop_codon:yes gene_type:complete
LNGQFIQSKSNLEEYLANLYPGDQVEIGLKRDNRTMFKNITLLNKDGGIGGAKHEIYHSKFLAADFEIVSKVERTFLQIDNGVKVLDFDARGYFSGFDLPKEFIVTAVNKMSIETPDQLDEISYFLISTFSVILLLNI